VNKPVPHKHLKGATITSAVVILQCFFYGSTAHAKTDFWLEKSKTAYGDSGMPCGTCHDIDPWAKTTVNKAIVSSTAESADVSLTGLTGTEKFIGWRFRPVGST